MYKLIYKLPVWLRCNASDTQAVGQGFEPRPDH